MKRNNYLLLCMVAAAAVFSCTKIELEEPQTTGGTGIQPDAAYTSEVAVKFDEETAALLGDDFSAGKLYTKSMPFNELVDELGIVSVRRIFSEDERFVERQHRAGLHLWYAVTVDPERSAVTKAAGDLALLPGVIECEPVRKSKSTAFNDPYYYQQWGFYNTSGADINVERVWEEYTCGSDEVIVAVVDLGVDLDHEDLAANSIPAGSGGSRNFMSGGGTYDVEGGDHGTHIAGVISAVNNNGVGISGIAGGDAGKGIKGVRILSCQVGEGDIIETLAAVDAIRYAADNGALIAQNSWGDNYDLDGDGRISAAELERASNAEISSYEKAAVDYFIDYAGCDNFGNQLPDSPMKGGVVFFAAGNDNIPYGAPANYERVVAVAAVGSNSRKASYSNYGDWVDICAPGTEIYSTLPDDKYGNMNGTSMACPFASGVAALLISEFGGPGFTNDMLLERILGGADPDAITSSLHIGPMLDAYGAFTYGGQIPPEPVEDYEVQGLGGSIAFEWTVTADEDNGKAFGYLLLASTDRSLLEGVDPRNLPEDVASAVVTVDDRNVGDAIGGRIPDLDFSAAYYVTITGYDYQHNYSALSEIKAVSTTSNNAPVIASEETGRIEIRPFQTVSRSFTVTDPDGHNMNMSFEAGSDAATFTEGDAENEWVLTVVGTAAPVGDYSAKISFTDAYGASASETVEYSILENRAPVATGAAEDVLLTRVGEAVEIDLAGLISDPDGETLKWSIANSSPGTVHATVTGNMAYVTALAFGNTEITVTATDVMGEQCSLSFSVVVKNPESPLEVFPNPVSDYLNVRTLDEAETTIRISTSTGALVYDETSQVSVFDPAVIDMRGYAPGKYTVNVSFGGGEYTRTVVKL